MNYDDLMDLILNTSSKDWLYSDERGIFTLKSNLNIRILSNPVDFENDLFEGESWATMHPDSTAYKVIYEIYYGASFIEEFTLVSVDGLRANLPMPLFGTTEVFEKEYNLAKAVDSLGTLDEYLQRSKLTIAST